MEQQTIYEQIDRFLADEMPVEELANFRTRISAEPALSAEVELVKGLKMAITDKKTPAFHQLLLEVEAGLEEGKLITMKPRTQNWRRPVAAAASVVILLAAAWFIFLRSPSSADLYAGMTAPAYQEMKTGFTERSQEAGPAAQAASALAKKNYAAALPALQLLAAQSPDDYELKIAIAFCQLETGQGPAAIQIFESIENGTAAADIRERAGWYKAAAFLKTGEKEKCRSILERIAGQPGRYAKEAGSLLEKL